MFESVVFILDLSAINTLAYFSPNVHDEGKMFYWIDMRSKASYLLQHVLKPFLCRQSPDYTSSISHTNLLRPQICGTNGVCKEKTDKLYIFFEEQSFHRKVWPFYKAIMHLSFEEVTMHSGHKVLMAGDDSSVAFLLLCWMWFV